MQVPRNPEYIHQQEGSVVENIREVVFGMQDGMVSTLGAITGVAVGSQDHFTVLLAGFAIISVESISMAIGSYTSSLSERDIQQRVLHEERKEIEEYPEEEKEEIVRMFIDDGWPKELAIKMSEAAAKNNELMLREMAYRELKVFPSKISHPFRNGIFMFVSYAIGGLIPLVPYFLLETQNAITVSSVITLIGLFGLGVGVTKYTKQNWLKSGWRMFTLAGVALIVGYLVGFFAKVVAGS
ncbi:MAG: VIT1/CCC1 transporter family protein [bacterium]|nr:VIT1/CCC1 transporter family protein [bacterium]